MLVVLEKGAGEGADPGDKLRMCPALPWALRGAEKLCEKPWPRPLTVPSPASATCAFAARAGLFLGDFFRFSFSG